jgi:hypothetical protein
MTSKVKLQKVIIYGGSRAFATRHTTAQPMSGSNRPLNPCRRAYQTESLGLDYYDDASQPI